MFIYVLIFLLLTGLALTYHKFDAYSKSLAFWIVLIFLMLFSALRGRYVDVDLVAAYGYFCQSIGDMKMMFTDFSRWYHGLPQPEMSFCVFVSFVKLFFSDPIRSIAVFYAVLGVTMKMVSIKRTSTAETFGLALLIYYSNLFFLQEMMQIRVGLATGIFFYALPEIYHRHAKKYFFLIILAGLIHRSAFLALPLYFLSSKSMNLFFWLALIVVPCFLYLTHFDVVSIIMKYNIPVLHEKLSNYVMMQDWLKIHLNPFNVLLIVQFLVGVVLYWKRELILPNCPYLLLLIKISFIGIIFFYLLGRVPVFAFRLNDFFGSVQVFLIPLLMYIFRQRWVGQLMVLAIAAGTFFIMLFHNSYISPYTLCFFD